MKILQTYGKLCLESDGHKGFLRAMRLSQAPTVPQYGDRNSFLEKLRSVKLRVVSVTQPGQCSSGFVPKGRHLVDTVQVSRDYWKWSRSTALTSGPSKHDSSAISH